MIINIKNPLFKGWKKHINEKLIIVLINIFLTNKEKKVGRLETDPRPDPGQKWNGTTLLFKYLYDLLIWPDTDNDTFNYITKIVNTYFSILVSGSV